MTEKLTVEELNRFFATEFPQTPVRALELGPMRALVRHEVGEAQLRPGRTVSGPVMMTTADVGLYAAILGEIGLAALTVTTSFTMNFMRKPVEGRALLGECRLLKLGKTLAVGEVSIYSEGGDDLVAHAVGTYAIPPLHLR